MQWHAARPYTNNQVPGEGPGKGNKFPGPTADGVLDDHGLSMPKRSGYATLDAFLRDLRHWREIVDKVIDG